MMRHRQRLAGTYLHLKHNLAVFKRKVASSHVT
jgi:hypothetical protein